VGDDPRYYSYHHDHHLYLARGRYLEHLAPWLDQIDPERMLVLPAESMFADPGDTFKTVQRFLGVDLDPDVSLRRYNQRSGPGLDNTTRAWLEDYYRPHNAALYSALGTDLGWDAPKDTDAAG
jgi:hypothetical protein